MTREEFIAKVEGCQKAFRRFLAALCCGDTSLADDIAQESFIKAYLSCNDLSDPAKFNAWIYRIGYNTFIISKRTQRISESLEASYQIPTSDKADDKFKYQALYMALGALNESERSAIVLYYMHGYSAEEISKIQGSTPAAIRQQLSRGRNHLRHLLTSDN